MKVNDRYVSLYYERDDIKGEIEIVQNRTALLIVDMQRIFVERPAEFPMAA